MTRWSPLQWPVIRQVRTGDVLGRGPAVTSERTRTMAPRTSTADRVVQSVCPYCAVGCGQRIYVKNERVVQIEGDPDSPVSRGRLCPKGSASEQLVNSPGPQTKGLYRPPHPPECRPLAQATPIDMVANRFIQSRRRTWQERDDKGRLLRRTMGIASLGGATLDNEENYLIKKLFTAAGAVQIEHQARICQSPPVPSLGTSFGRGGATQSLQDMANADCIVIQGSNMAECHPVGFQWVAEAKARGAKIIHVDPRFTRTSAIADKHIPIRAGSDVVLLGALINHVLTHDLWFKEYVVAYTNAATLVTEDFRDTEDLGGLFSGFDPETGQYDPATWAYAEPDGDRLRDETLQHPRTVFQILKRHYARYTPEMVRDVCGVSIEDFDYLARSIVENSGRERTTCFAYAVGWTQHTLGAQFIRTATILQLLMGNVGRPGSGIMALRGHASIQGSTDIPTLFNLLPGYLPMPKAGVHDTLAAYLA